MGRMEHYPKKATQSLVPRTLAIQPRPAVSLFLARDFGSGRRPTVNRELLQSECNVAMWVEVIMPVDTKNILRWK